MKNNFGKVESYRNTVVYKVNTEIPNKFQSIYRHRQCFEYRNTVQFFPKYRNTGQKKGQYRVTENLETPPLNDVNLPKVIDFFRQQTH